jgi:parallel beta-helix repeat protein
MIKKKKISILVLLFFLTVFMSSINLEYKDNLGDSNNDFNNLRSSAYYNPDPFYIDDSETGVGAHNWTWAVGQAWCSGSGTWGDPYIIEDVVINTTTPGTRIEIRNSIKPFIIKNCTLYNGGMNNVIKFEYVSNGTIYNSTIDGSVNQYGIYIDHGFNNTISNNTIRNNNNGMRLYATDNNTVSKNYFKDQSSYAISGYYTGSDYSDNNTISDNLITGSSGGITFTYGYDNVIRNNNITDLTSGSGTAIFAKYHGRYQIVGNLLKNIAGIGINIDSSDNNNVSLNTLLNIGGRGIWVEYCEYLTLKNNTMNNSGLDLLKANTGSPIEEIDSHDIDTSNKINGKIIYYYIHMNNLGSADFLNAGQIYLVDCNDSVISNLELSNGTQGMKIFNSYNITIDNTNITDNLRQGVYLWESSSITFKGCSINNNLVGIYALRGGYNNFSNNVFINNSGNGIDISTASPNNTISDNFISGNEDNGIDISGHNTTITYNNITSNAVDGIYTSSDGHRIIGNRITDNLDEGIEISGGDNVLLFNNTIENNGVIGLRLASVENLTMQYNNLTNDGINLIGTNQDLTSHSIDTTNTVNNKPVYYYTYSKDLGASDFINAGQVLLAFCNDSIISNQDLSNGTVGVSLFDCKNITIEDNNITNFGFGAYNGIYLIRTPFSVIKGNIINGTSYMGIYTATGCPNNTIDNNIVKNINMYGIYLTSGHNSTISNNTIYDIGKWGITLTSSENCTIIKNNCYNTSERGIYISGASYYTKVIENNFTNNQDYGIFVSTGKNITISSNNASDNQKYGIYVKSSQDINITGNLMEDNAEYGLYLESNDDPMVFLNNFTRCGIGFYGTIGEVTSTIADQSNLVNGKILYIYININYLTPTDFPNAGEIVLLQCSHSTISNLDFGEGSIGIYLFYSDNNTIINVNISNENVYGIYSRFSDFNNFSRCFVNNNTNGIYLDDSDNTIIYWNDIQNNINHGVWDDLGINSSISSNNISGNGVYGINLDGNDNATVFNNTIGYNNNFGVTADVSSQSNLIYMNSFIGNTYHAKDDGSYSRWDNGTIGNFWDNITDKDIDDDGIADNSIYNIPGTSLKNDTKPMYWDAPVLNATSPINNTLFGKNAPSYSVIIEEGRGDTFWYVFLETGGNSSAPMIGSLKETTSGQFSQSLWNALSNGTRIIRFYMNDSRGYINFTDAIVRVDKIAPTITLNISPNPSNGITNIQAFNTTEVISGSLLANVSTPLGYIYLTLNYQGLNEWINTFDVNLYGSGTYWVYVNGTDHAGNVGYAPPDSILGDLVDPTITLNVTPDPSNGITTIQAFNTTEVISGSLLANVSTPLGYIYLTLNYQGLNEWTNTFDINSYGSGTYWVYVNGTDRAGNVGYATPDSILGDLVDPTITLNVTPDPSNGITTIQAFNTTEVISGSLLANVSTPSGYIYLTLNYQGLNEWTNTFDVNLYGSGPYWVYVNGTDRAGNVGYATPDSIIGDLTPPTISIGNPEPLDIFGSNYPYYNITIVADNLDSVWYTLDGGSNNYTITGAIVGVNTGNLNATAWDAIVADGNYLLNFYVNETSANIANQSVWIEKDITQPIVNITRPFDAVTITDLVPILNATVVDKNYQAIWYSLDLGITNNTFSGNVSIDEGLWKALSDGTIYIRVYANDSVGNIGWDQIAVTKKTTTPNGGNGPPEGIDPMLMIIIIGAVAGIAVLSIFVVSKRSKRELKEKEAEIESLKLQRKEITEGDILISKEQHFCLVHKGSIKGMSYICPDCGAYYCVKCYNAIKEAENECWSCSTPLDASKPSVKSKEKTEAKPKKKEDIEITVEDTKIEAPKKTKGPKTDLTSLPPKPTPPEKKLKIRAPPVEKPEEPSKLQPETPAEAPKKEAPLQKEQAIKKFDDYIEQLNALVQKLDIKFNAGTITQEEYIEKKTVITEKLGEAMAKRDQLKE